MEDIFMSNALQWTTFASQLEGSGFVTFQRELARFNRQHLQPGLPSKEDKHELESEARVLSAETDFVEAVRDRISSLARDIPGDADRFVAWFERLRDNGPGQGDPLFPWLERAATLDQMRWFIEQEVAGEAGFDDLLALTQIKMPEQAKLEMARNYWDEMGRGRSKGMHGPMLERLARHLDVHPTPETVVPEALALGNMMVALARHRAYAFHSIGALGAIEMTAPTRAGYVDRGLRRLGIPAKKRHYFALHAVLDVRHSECWNREVVRPLVRDDTRRAHAIGEGALLRLWHGAQCFEHYRQKFALVVPPSKAA
jgi:Iron-containing redox enzyme